jgi:hypothetical protein
MAGNRGKRRGISSKSTANTTAGASYNLVRLRTLIMGEVCA